MDRATPVSRYLASRDRFGRFVGFLWGCFEGAWLGLLTRDELHALDEHYYDLSSEYQTDAWNCQGLFTWEGDLIGAHFPADGRLLVLAAGGGREVLALQEKGYAVDGYECHPKLVAYANRLLQSDGHPPAVGLSPRDWCPPLIGTYDGLVVGWGSYMLIQGRPRRVALLQSLRQHVRPGTPVLLSFFHRGMSTRRYRLIAAVANGIRTVRRREPVDIGDGLHPNYVHFFSEADVADELAAGGFEIVHFGTRDQYGQAVGRAI